MLRLLQDLKEKENSEDRQDDSVSIQIETSRPISRVSKKSRPVSRATSEASSVVSRPVSRCSRRSRSKSSFSASRRSSQDLDRPHMRYGKAGEPDVWWNPQDMGSPEFRKKYPAVITRPPKARKTCAGKWGSNWRDKLEGHVLNHKKIWAAQ